MRAMGLPSPSWKPFQNSSCSPNKGRRLWAGWLALTLGLSWSLKEVLALHLPQAKGLQGP